MSGHAHIKWQGTVDAAHFIPGHPKCGRLHGHTYHIEVDLAGILPSESPIYLIDFAKVKEIVMRLDHRLICPVKYMADPMKTSSRCEVFFDKSNISLPWDHVALLDAPESSTECLALWLADALLHAQENLLTAEVWIGETPSTKAHALACK